MASSSNGQVVFSGNEGDDVNVAFVGMESLLEKGKNVPDKRQACGTRRTSLELLLIAFSVVTCVIAVCLIIVLAVKGKQTPTSSTDSNSSRKTVVLKDGNKVCIDQECVQAASRLLEYSNFHVDPCSDFFEYACGTWNRRHVIPPDASVFNMFSSHKDAVSVKLKDLLEHKGVDDDIDAIKKVKDYYKACTSEQNLEEYGLGPLRDEIKILGGWPVVEGYAWDSSKFDLVNFIINLALRQIWVFVYPFVSADDKRSHVNIIQLDQTKLGLNSRNYFLQQRDDKNLVVYENYARRIAIALGADRETAKRDMKEMVDFEMKLAAITIPPEGRLNSTAMYNKMTIGELQKNISGFEWSRYLRTLFSKVNVNITDREDVVLFATEYFKRMVPLLAKTDRRLMANYGVWIFVMSQMENLPKLYRDLGKEYRKVFEGTTSDRDRWRTCVSSVTSRLGDAVGRMFVTIHFDEENRQNALAMIHQIRTAFYELIEEVPWMDDGTKVVAKEKAEKIQEKIGYPTYILNDDMLNKEYSDIKLDSKNHFLNNMKCLKREMHRRLSQLGKPVSLLWWVKPPTVINAFYISSSNQILLPAGILQPPFYSKGYPKSVNFGGIGMVIGHEITHGFDDKGRKYDKDGNMVQWWPDDVIHKFMAQAQCMVDQYSNFTIKSINKKAYRNWVSRDNGGVEEPRLPGLLNFTHDQLFFLNFAQVVPTAVGIIYYLAQFSKVWCGTMRKVAAEEYVRTKIHSPGQFRVRGTLQNSYDFAKAYRCAVGTPMNPKKKCSVW